MSGGGVMVDGMADTVDVAGAGMIDTLAGIAGADAVLSGVGQRIFFATDAADRGVTAEAVVRAVCVTAGFQESEVFSHAVGEAVYLKGQLPPPQCRGALRG